MVSEQEEIKFLLSMGSSNSDFLLYGTKMVFKISLFCKGGGCNREWVCEEGDERECVFVCVCELLTS